MNDGGKDKQEKVTYLRLAHPFHQRYSGILQEFSIQNSSHYPFHLQNAKYQNVLLFDKDLRNQ